MTTQEAIARLQSSNEDLVLMRVAGSVGIKVLDTELQGKLNWVERDELLDAMVQAVSKGTNLV